MRYRKKPLIIIVSLILVVALAILIINIPFLSVLKKRLLSMFGTLITGDSYDTSTTTRFVWQLYGLHLGFKQVIFGYGYYGFGIYSGVGTYTHSNYAEIICDYGIVGFLLFYGIIVFALYESIKKRSDNIWLIVVFTIIFVIESFMTVYYQNKTTFLIFGIIYYLISVRSSFEKKIIITDKNWYSLII